MSKRDERFHAGDETREVVLTPIDDALPTKVLTVTYGTWKVEDKPDASRFEVIGVRVIDGVEVPDYLYGVKADAAIGRMANKLYAAFDLSDDDIANDADFEGDEFYAQKIAAPKPIKDNVWKMDAYKDKLEELSTLRAEAEEALGKVAEGERASEDDNMAVSKIIAHVIDLCDGDSKLVQSWAAGATDSSNTPLLERFGKGINALAEAATLARLTEFQLRVKPVSMNSGKAIQRHRAMSIDHIAKEAGRKAFKSLNGENFSAEGLSLVVRRAAEDIGVPDAGAMIDGEYVTGIDEVLELTDAAVAAMVVNFEDTYGKSVSMYDKDSQAAAFMAFGAVTLSSAGEGQFAATVKAMGDAAEAEDDAKAAAIIAKLNSNRGVLFVKKATEAAIRHAADVAKAGKAKELLDGADDNEVADIRAKLGDLNADGIAGRVYKVLAGHPQANDAWKALQTLVSQHPLENAKAEPEADAA